MGGATKRGRGNRGTVLAAVLAHGVIAAAAVAMPMPAIAQGETVARFDIPAQPLLDAMVLFNRQAGIQISAGGGVAAGRTSQAIKGAMPASRALARLLAGTGLDARWIDARTVVLAPARVAAAPQPAGEADDAAATAAAAAAAQVLPEVIADGEQGESYAMGSGAAFGESVIGRAEIQARAAGSGDANQLLKILPTVQFSTDEGLATREDIMDLRPANLSISGGRYYDNLITLDGVDVNSRMDTTQTTPENVYELAGASAEAIWVDTNLIGQITVRDSNVSAQYGRFTGGTLDVTTRAPKRAWGGTATASFTSDALTHFRVSDKSRAALADSAMPEQPSFQKWRYGATLDIPVSADVGVLLAYNRSRADVTYSRAAAYGGARFNQTSISDTMLAKFDADLSGNLKLNGQIAYAPYSSEYADDAAVDNTIKSKGGGVTGKLELARSGTSAWTITATFAHNDSGREAASTRYRVSSWTSTGQICTSTNCTIGSYGNLDQTQDTFGLAARWSRKLGIGTIAAGIDYQHIAALRRRPEDNYFYSTSTAQSAAARIVCADGNNLGCITGEYALTTAQRYAAYTARVRLDSVADWAEFSTRLGRVAIRAGLRHDYESFLGNHTVAPRFSATYDLPWTDWSVSLGANRYYGRSMLAYALRAQYPDNYSYRRTATVTNGMSVYSDSGWVMSATSHSASYAGGRAKTPYSDELSAALAGRVLGGSLRVKGIYREGRNEFTRSSGETTTSTLDNGNIARYTSYVITNDGFSTYRGGSIEWTRTVGKHSFAINANYSKTKSSNWDYFDNIDDITEGTMVAFGGQAMSYAEIEQLNQRANMAAPLIINASWTGRWFADRLTTNVNLRYRNGYKRIEDTGQTTTIAGTSYDVYDYVDYPKSVDANLNTRFEVIRSALGGLAVEARVANLFDRTPSPNSTATAQPYQFGRSVWLGVSFTY